MWGASRSCCCCVLVYFPALVLSDCNQTGDDTCKWRGDALWSKLWGNQTGISESFDCLSKNNLTASNSQLPFSQTSELNVSSTFQRQDTFLSGFFSPSFFFCRSALERLKPQHISAVTKPARWNVPFHAARRKSVKCGDTKKNRFCTIQQAKIKVSASLSNSPVTLDTSPFFLLTSVKGTCDQVKRNLTGTLSGAGVKFWVKKNVNSNKTSAWRFLQIVIPYLQGTDQSGKQQRVHAGRRELLFVAHYEPQIVKRQTPGVPS